MGSLSVPRGYRYGYGDWYTPSIGNDKALDLAISNLKLVGQTGGDKNLKDGHNREKLLSVFWTVRTYR